MIKATKNKAILAAVACSLCFGLTGVATMQTAYAETQPVSMTTLVGATSDNVTVSATSSGLQLTRTDATVAWSARIDSLFTGTTAISYRTTDREANNWVIEANAFTVKDFYGEEVARFIIANDFWGLISDEKLGLSKAFLYNPSTGAYTTAAVTDGVAGGYTSVSQRALTDAYHFERIPDFYPSPAAGAAGNVVGTVTFAYADGKLTVSTSTFDVADLNKDDTTKVGNGQTVAVGEVEVNLDQGYTITVGSATDLTLPDGTAFSYPYSSNVIISDINGCDTTKTLTTNGKTGDIVYYSAKSQESKNSVISLNNGASLNKFYYVEQTKCTDENGNELFVSPRKVAFDYADNHAFTAREEITVVYGGANKGYIVDVTNDLPTVATKDLVNVSENVTLTTGSSVTWTDSSSVSQTQNGLLVSSPKDSEGLRTAAWSADLNGIFTGSTDISYYMTEFYNYWGDGNKYTAGAFTIKTTDGTKVADFVVLRNNWQEHSKAYVYDAINDKYTTQKVAWTGDPARNRYKGLTELTPAANADAASYVGFTSSECNEGKMYVSPAISTEGMNQVTVDHIYGTVTFDYVGNTLTIKTTTYNVGGDYGLTGEDVVGCGQTIEIGKIEGVDLSEGYTISIGSAPNIPYTDGGEFSYSGSSPFLLVKINGQDVTGTAVQTTGVTQDIQTTNTVKNGAIEISKGEELGFVSNSTVSIGSMQVKGSAGITVNTVYGAYAEFGDSGVVTVKDATGARKDFSVRVKGLSEELMGTEMNAGASIRTAEPYGIRFQMNVSAADKALIEGNVGADKAYVSVKYGMIIMPYSYVAQYGGLTEENLFGESAVYTWKDKVGSGTTQIMLRYSENGLQANGGNYALWYANTGLTGSAITMQFIGAGFIELTKADGTKEYKIVSKYEGYNENDETTFANTNVRSCYEVAVLAYEDKSATAPSDTVKQFLLENYLIPNGYKQGNGGE